MRLLVEALAVMAAFIIMVPIMVYVLVWGGWILFMHAIGVR